MVSDTRQRLCSTHCSHFAAEEASAGTNVLLRARAAADLYARTFFASHPDFAFLCSSPSDLNLTAQIYRILYWLGGQPVAPRGTLSGTLLVVGVVRTRFIPTYLKKFLGAGVPAGLNRWHRGDGKDIFNCWGDHGLRFIVASAGLNSVFPSGGNRSGNGQCRLVVRICLSICLGVVALLDSKTQFVVIDGSPLVLFRA